MAYFQNGNANLYYEDVGEGEPIFTNHGVTEDTTYWSEPGVTAALAEQYRVISIDMRGHGRTIIEGEPKGFDEVTMGDDFTALADHLGFEKFHILSHATGGMYAARYGIRHSDRLYSLMLTDTGSETLPTMYHPDGHQLAPVELEERQKAAQTAREELMNRKPPFPAPPYHNQRRAGWLSNLDVFTFKMAEHPYADKMFSIMEGWGQRRLSQEALAEFYATFYRDPDPMVEGLRQVKCPTLVLLGEYDYVFVKPSELMAKEIPDNRHVVMRGCGHMTAMEAPKWTAHELLDFLQCVRETGHANW